MAASNKLNSFKQYEKLDIFNLLNVLQKEGYSLDKIKFIGSRSNHFPVRIIEEIKEDFLRKPFSQYLLLEKVRKVLDIGNGNTLKFV